MHAWLSFRRRQHWCSVAGLDRSVERVGTLERGEELHGVLI